MKTAKTISAMVTVRARVRLPAVISDNQSRQPSRSSWLARKTNVSGRLTRQQTFGRPVAIRRPGRETYLPDWWRFPGLVAQFVERAFGDQPAMGDDADAVGHALGYFENMRGHDDGAAGTHALLEHVFDLAR